VIQKTATYKYTKTDIQMTYDNRQYKKTVKQQIAYTYTVFVCRIHAVRRFIGPLLEKLRGPQKALP